MKVNYNISAMISNNNLRINDNKLSESTGRLSTGLKINKAKDNPAGLAMARRMNAQIKSLQVANDSAKDGVNVIQTADGVLSEMHGILQRMNELTVKAANGTMMTVDRQYIQDEILQLKDEIQRIADTAEFNGQRIFDGTFDYRGYATDMSGATNPAVSVNYYDEIPAAKYRTNLGSQLSEKVYPYASLLGYDKNTNTLSHTGGNISDLIGTEITLTNTEKSTDTITMKITKISGDIIKMENDKGQALDMKIQTANPGDIMVDLTGIGAMTVQVGANEGQVIDVRVPKVSLSTLGIFNTDVTYKRFGEDFAETWKAETADEWRNNNPAGMGKSDDEIMAELGYHTPEEVRGAAMADYGQKASQMSISEVKDALAYVSKIRSRLGSYQNRLEQTESNLDVMEENMTASYSQLMDVDMAEEMTSYSTANVLSQAGISILAQANERPSQALQLLQ